MSIYEQAPFSPVPAVESEQQLRDSAAHLVLVKPVAPEDLVLALRATLDTIETAQGTYADLEELYAATRPALRSIARRRFGLDAADADDVMQETWLLFLEKRASISTPRTWLCGAAANLCRRRIDRRVRERERSSEMPDHGGVAPAPEGVLSLRRAITQLDGRTRNLFTMIGVEQHSYAEVSKKLGIPLGSVGPMYMRAKAELRVALAA